MWGERTHKEVRVLYAQAEITQVIMDQKVRWL